ncbi:alpha/beta hydrolase [Longispora sp. K20-0274]|uniref:RBBP9/YdeN family alpha/beta hydrolase n=1 Tax=Longispora sp. K20-0274 TaxID=3088255 RepID=UPI00399A5A9D
MTVLFVDGWYGPEPGDWQAVWSTRLPGAARVAQDDWERPDREAWVARLDEAVARCPEPPVLVAHSLGCVTVAHWVAGGAARPVRAALAVTPADVERNPKPEITGFSPVPRLPWPFPTILAASANDSWMRPDRAVSFAASWGARLVDVGPVGHLTGADGPWSAGERLLAELRAPSG